MFSQKFLMPAITQVYGIYLNEISGSALTHAREFRLAGLAPPPGLVPPRSLASCDSPED